jgi:hypothetical protein
MKIYISCLVDEVDAGLNKALCQTGREIVGKKKRSGVGLSTILLQLQKEVLEPRQAEGSLDLVKVGKLPRLRLEN